MRIGFHLTPFWSPATRGASELLDEVVGLVGAASRMGFSWVSAPHHFLGHPSFFPHPFPVLARLAPEAGTMRLKTNVLILPLLNAVDAAEGLATLDHIAHGRLDVGVGIGYRDTELEAAGVTRKDRTPKLEESLALMKRLWSGEEVSFEGRYTRLTRARMGYRPYQRPYPFIEMAAQSVAATQRAARLTDGVFFGPQVGWRDIGALAAVFRETRAAATPASGPGSVLASRSLIVGPTKEAAAAAAREFLEKTFAQYRAWSMQEPRMVSLRLDFDASLDDWAVYGSPRDCVEALERGREMGLDGVGFTMYSLPGEMKARADYLHMVAEDILKPAGALAP